MRPRIAVSGVLRYWQDACRAGVNAAYLSAVARAGGIPLILSQLMGEVSAAGALEGCHGLLLTGGEDVDPSHYGAEPSSALGSVDGERDRFELALFAAARAAGVPVLGICRGIQVINVALGGTLYQDLPSERPGPVDHNPDAARNAEPITYGSRREAAPPTRSASTGSFPILFTIRQSGIWRRPMASGWTDDGLVEAVEGARRSLAARGPVASRGDARGQLGARGRALVAKAGCARKPFA